MHETVECGYRTYICEETELLTHCKESLFRANLCSWVIIKLRIANRSEKHSIGFLTSLEGFLWEWVANFINGMGTTECLFITNFVSELLSYGVHYGNTLLHYFRSDTITGQYCDFQFHIISCCFVVFSL